MLKIIPPSPKYSKQIWEFFKEIDGDEYLRNIDFSLNAAHRLAYYGGDDVHTILVYNEKVIAYGWIRGWTDDWDDKCLGLIVSPKYRGMGIGELMCRTLLTVASLRALNRVRLHVDEHNRPAIELYKKLGFEFKGERKEDELIGYLYYS